MAASLPRLEQNIARDIIAVEAEQFHAKNFRDEGFTDTTLQKWPKRKTTIKNTKSYEGGIYELNNKDKGKAVLVQSSTLKGHALKGRVWGSQVKFVFPLEYEKVHNEGGRAGRGTGFQMPKRQFVGESEYLKNRIEAKAQKYMDQFFKNI